MDTNTKILIGVGLGVLLFGRRQAVGIGKIDSTGHKFGNRIDKYWGDVVPKNWIRGDLFSQVPDLKDPTKVVSQFNLHSIEFGNWLNQQDRASFLNGAYQSLHNIAKIFGVNQSYLGLNKKLLIGLGSRGNGGRAVAFYQPGYIAINLTKTKGPGSFAHEYAHALDHYSNWKYRRKGFASGGRSTTKSTRAVGSDTEQLYEQIFSILFEKENGSPTSFALRLRQQSEYLNRRTEIFARLFERYCHLKLEAQNTRNRFLTEPATDPGTPPDSLIYKAEPILRKLVKTVLS